MSWSPSRYTHFGAETSPAEPASSVSLPPNQEDEFSESIASDDTDTENFRRKSPKRADFKSELSEEDVSENEGFFETKKPKSKVSREEVSKLHTAIKNNSLDEVKHICIDQNPIKQDKSIETWNLINEEYEGYTALQLAAWYRRVDIVAYLLGLKACLVKQNAAGMDALMCALAPPPDNLSVHCTKENKNTIFNLFLQNNPQFGNRNNRDRNILFYAAEVGDSDAFAKLLELLPGQLNAMLTYKIKGTDLESFIANNKNIVTDNKRKMLVILRTKLADRAVQSVLPADRPFNDDISEAALSKSDIEEVEEEESPSSDDDFESPRGYIPY